MFEGRTLRAWVRSFVVILMILVVVVQPLSALGSSVSAGASNAVRSTSTTQSVTITSTTLVVNQSNSSNYDFIQNAIDNASAGATIDVTSGTYNETLQIDKPLTLRGQPGGSQVGPATKAPVLDANQSRHTAIFLRDGVSNVTVTGLEIREYNGKGIWADPDPTSNVTITHNHIHNITGAKWPVGIVSRFAQDGKHTGWQIHHNEFADIGFAAVHLTNAQDSVVGDNVITGGRNVTNPFSANSTIGISVQSRSVTHDSLVVNITVRNNTLHGPFDFRGIQAFSVNRTTNTSAHIRDITFRNNHITNPPARIGNEGLYGVGMGVASPNTSIRDVAIAENEIQGWTTGVRIGDTTRGSVADNDIRRVEDGVAIVDSTRVVIAKNSLRNNSGTGISLRSDYPGATAHIAIMNNSIRNHSDGGISVSNGTNATTVPVHQNRIQGNVPFGLMNADPRQVNASFNWWGTSNGPSGVFNGSGDAVFGNVSVSPFYTDANQTRLTSNVTRTGIVVNKSDPTTFDSIQNAVENAPPGATVKVHTAVYNESIFVDKSIRIIGDPGKSTPGAASSAPILDGGRIKDRSAFRFAHGVENVTIAGFEIRNYGNSSEQGARGHGFDAWNRSTENVTVRDNTVHDTGWTGIMFGGNGQTPHSGTVIANNYVYNATFYGIEFKNVRSGRLVDNRIKGASQIANSGLREGNHSDGGLVVAAESRPASVEIGNVEVRNNTVIGPFDWASLVVGVHDFESHGAPANASARLENVTVSENTLVNGTYGVVVFFGGPDTTASDLEVRNTTVRGHKDGVAIGSFANASTESVYLRGMDLRQNKNGVFIPEGTNATPLKITNSWIVGNDQGIVHEGANELNASYNYWGAADGPSGDFTGSGDAVFGNVSVSPFYADANLRTLTSNVSQSPPETVIINGALQRPNGDRPATDYVVAIEAGETIPDGLLDTNQTGADGQFAVTVPANLDYDLGVSQYNETANHLWQRDGTVDLYAFDRRNDTADVDLANVTLPDGHLVHVQVVDESGNPVEGARVNIMHVNESTGARTFSVNNPTDADGLLVAKAFDPLDINRSDNPGIELRGNVTFAVRPPRDPRFVETVYLRELTVDNQTNVTVVLEEQAVVNLTGTLREADGSTATADTILARGRQPSESHPLSVNSTSEDGRFKLTVPGNRTYDLLVGQINETANHLGERDGTVDFFAFERRNDSADVNRGNISLPQGHVVNITVVDESGVPVSNASIDITHYNDNTSARMTTTNHPTNDAGQLVAKRFDPLGLERSTVPGLELRGNVTFMVQPPDDARFANRTYTRKLSVTNATTVTVTLEERSVVVVCPGCGVPTDPDGDGLSEDLNGNGALDFDDVVVFFQHLFDPEVTDHTEAYDFNDNGRVDFDDIVSLFEEL